jgi:2-dehydropantoate 2-reductase
LGGSGRSMNRSIAVLGAGAVGGYLAGLLAAADQQVTLIGRPHTIRPIEAHGLLIRRLNDQTIYVWPNTCADPAMLESHLFDCVLLSVKAYDVERAVPDLELLLGDSGLVVAFQNGVGSDERLIERFGSNRVVAATLTVSVGVERPGEITQYTSGGGIALAPYSTAHLPEWLVDSLAATGLPLMQLARADSLRWSKLLLNMLGSAQSAILDVNLDMIATNRALFRVEQLTIREALAVMRAARIPIVDLPGYPVRLLAYMMRLPTWLARPLLAPHLARGRGGKSPTMRADMARGSGLTESVYLNGAVAAHGTLLSVATPVNSALHQLVSELAHCPDEWQRFHGKPQELLAFLRAQGANV